VDLGDRWSFYCVVDEAGKIILEQKVSTTPEAMVFPGPGWLLGG
jgi:transposase